MVRGGEGSSDLPGRQIGEAEKSKNPVEVGVFGRPFSESGTSQAAIFSVPPSNRIVVGCFFFSWLVPRRRAIFAYLADAQFLLIVSAVST